MEIEKEGSVEWEKEINKKCIMERVELDETGTNSFWYEFACDFDTGFKIVELKDPRNGKNKKCPLNHKLEL